MKEYIISLVGSIVLLVITVGMLISSNQPTTPVRVEEVINLDSEKEPVNISVTIIDNTVEAIVEHDFDIIEYLAKCVEAEAGNQSLLGKRLVVDVILNRVDSDRFPDSIEEVINEAGQFTVVENGSIDTVEVSEETYLAIDMELKNRIDNEILFFTSSGYLGTPCYKVDAHYFGK